MKTERNLFACLLLSLFLAACGGGGSNDGGNGGGGSASGEKLLVRVVTEGSGERTFQYDEQNRLIADSDLGEGNKIEYVGDDVRPSLVTNGIPYPIWSGYDANNNYVSIPIAYVQYQYGEDDLFGSALTKYYQTQILDQNQNLIWPNYADRYYLDSGDREIAHGFYNFSNNSFSKGRYNDIAYDERGNLLRWSRTESCGPACLRTVISEYTYDDKKGSATGMATPLWWFANGSDDFSGNFLANPNNPLSYVVTFTYPGNHVVLSLTETYNYTYDQDGYPAAVDVTREPYGVQATTYRKTFHYIPAH